MREIRPFVREAMLTEPIAAYFAEVTSVPYLRMDALYAFTHDGRMKQDMLGHVMGDYVLRGVRRTRDSSPAHILTPYAEYQNALKELGDVDDGYPRAAPQKSWSMFALGRELASDSALVLLGIKMVFNPQAIPLVSIAVLEQTSVALSNTMQRLFFGGGSILEAFNGVKALYEIADIENDLVDGTEPYPIAGSVAKGMEVEFKWVDDNRRSLSLTSSSVAGMSPSRTRGPAYLSSKIFRSRSPLDLSASS